MRRRLGDRFHEVAHPSLRARHREAGSLAQSADLDLQRFGQVPRSDALSAPLRPHAGAVVPEHRLRKRQKPRPRRWAGARREHRPIMPLLLREKMRAPIRPPPARFSQGRCVPLVRLHLASPRVHPWVVQVRDPNRSLGLLPPTSSPNAIWLSFFPGVDANSSHGSSPFRSCLGPASGMSGHSATTHSGQLLHLIYFFLINVLRAHVARRGPSSLRGVSK